MSTVELHTRLLVRQESGLTAVYGAGVEEQRVRVLSNLCVQREAMGGGGRGEGGCQAGGVWQASRTWGRRDGRVLGDREQEKGSFMERLGPKHSAPHQIQDSVLDRGERKYKEKVKGGGEEEGCCSDGRRFEKTNGQRLLAG